MDKFRFEASWFNGDSKHARILLECDGISLYLLLRLVVMALALLG
ncbi:MAG: hypothetical protein ACSHWN_05420 [Methylophilaceae bacterium]